jgi:hypothetical protein
MQRVDLSRKILIFLDQPHNQLLQRLRPLLSHDKKEISLKITDKHSGGGLKAKNVVLLGYPAVIFCTAGLNIDEQEASRFILLSPETSQEKIRAALNAKLSREMDRKVHQESLDNNYARSELKKRIEAIKLARIGEIKLASTKLIEERFLKDKPKLKPRHSRDLGRLISLVKISALLNLWYRQRDGDSIIAEEQDVREVMGLWDEIAVSQELNLPPYVYNFYKDIIKGV